MLDSIRIALFFRGIDFLGDFQKKPCSIGGNRGRQVFIFSTNKLFPFLCPFYVIIICDQVLKTKLLELFVRCTCGMEQYLGHVVRSHIHLQCKHISFNCGIQNISASRKSLNGSASLGYPCGRGRFLPSIMNGMLTHPI